MTPEKMAEFFAPIIVSTDLALTDMGRDGASVSEVHQTLISVSGCPNDNTAAQFMRLVIHLGLAVKHGDRYYATQFAPVPPPPNGRPDLRVVH